MNTGYINHRIAGMAFTLMLMTSLVGCNSDSHFFHSGLAKEWSPKQPISYESLAMNPSYYFYGLGDDLGNLAWLALPRGRLFQDMRDEYQIRQIQQVLKDYLGLLESLPNGRDYPEYQLTTLYHDLAADYVDYLDGQTSMYTITNRLASVRPAIAQLEKRLEEAGDRRLTVLLQTFPRYAQLR